MLRDARRRLLQQPEWIEEHFRTRGRPAGHGFSRGGTGYYASRRSPASASSSDWPQQARAIELVENGDGTMSILATAVDHAGPASPGPRPRRAGRLLSSAEVGWLAAVARQIAWNDPDNDGDERRGTRADRNVELVVPYGVFEQPQGR